MSRNRAARAVAVAVSAAFLGTVSVALAPPGGAATSVLVAYALAAPLSESPSGLVARAVVPAGASCPLLDVRVAAPARVERRSLTMYARKAPATTSPAFDSITVCSARIPLNAVSASIAGLTIPSALPARADHLALFGDSGCRIASWQVQDCASVEAWPLASISQSIADDGPDAVIFNGDFFYREAACPTASQAECGSSPPPVGGLPFTDSAYGWLADVLLPMTPILSKAPLIVTRGNHEECNRAGNGYFLLFDPRTGTEGTCAPVAGASGVLEAAPTVPSATYAIDLQVTATRTLRLAIVDSAGGSDTKADAFAAVQRPAYESAARLTQQRHGRESWLVTHRPVYAYVTSTFAQPGAPFNPWSSVDQTAASFGLLGTYDLVFSSHLHLAQAVQIPGQPGQLVLGNGGTLLDPAVGYELPATGPVGAPGQTYPAPSWAWVAPRFGYAIATPSADGGAWRLQMKDPLGGTFARCGVRSGSIYCADTPPLS